MLRQAYATRYGTAPAGGDLQQGGRAYHSIAQREDDFVASPELLAGRVLCRVEFHDVSASIVRTRRGPETFLFCLLALAKTDPEATDNGESAIKEEHLPPPHSPTPPVLCTGGGGCRNERVKRRKKNTHTHTKKKVVGGDRRRYDSNSSEANVLPRRLTSPFTRASSKLSKMQQLIARAQNIPPIEKAGFEEWHVAAYWASYIPSLAPEGGSRPNRHTDRRGSPLKL